jgi:hypothetical protein
MDIKPYKDYDERLRNTFKMISFQKKNVSGLLMGSSTYEVIEHPSDVDMFEIVIEEKDADVFKRSIIKKLRSIFQEIQKERSVYFIEFMANDRKWTIDEVMSDEFNTSIFDSNSFFKLEVVKRIDDILVPISIVYEFYAKGKDTLEGLNQEKPTLNDIKSLNDDIRKFKKEGNIMKMFKRMYAKAIMQKDRTIIDYLTMVFNSDFGHLYMLINDLKTCLSVSKLYNKPTDDRNIRNFLLVIYDELSTLKLFDFTILQHRLMKRCIRAKNASRVDLLNKLIASLKRTLTVALKRANV